MEDSPPLVVWNMIPMLWHVLINSEDFSSAPSSSNWINGIFLSLLLNVLAGNLRISRCGNLILDGNTAGYEVTENIE